jgi:hypothetical protein
MTRFELDWGMVYREHPVVPEILGPRVILVKNDMVSVVKT